MARNDNYPKTLSNASESIFEECENELLGLFKNIPLGSTDIMLNPDGTCHYATANGASERTTIAANDKTLRRIACVLASCSNQNLNENSPCISCILPKSGYRAEILTPPVVDRISISIRIPNSDFHSLTSLIRRGMLDENQARIIRRFAIEKKNIAISGQTGSGKTTLLCALANEIPASERIIVIEDETREISIKRPDVVSIVAKKDVFSGRDAVKSALRMNPDRILYGETRDGQSAMELLKAFRTGHSGGMFTIHATSASHVIRRLEDLLAEVTPSDGIKLIADSVDAALHLDFDKNGRRYLKEIKELNRTSFFFGDVKADG